MGVEMYISVILLFVGIAVFVVIHVCIVKRAFGRGENNGQDMISIANRMNILGSTRMSSEELKTLPCFNYKAPEGVVEEGSEKGWMISPVDCAVCLENFKVGENCRLLPNCNHCFHSQCIDSWLFRTPFCPVCRTCALPVKIGVTLNEEIEDVPVAVGVE